MVSGYWIVMHHYHHHNWENESDTEFLNSIKGWGPIWEEITLPESYIVNYDDDGNDSEDDKDHAGDGYNGVQMIDSTKSCFSAIFKIKSN